ncbi:MAG: CBS domain-containing protein [Thiogranum sp.]|nr:CBS domain-containing protein [Thiogranum sp.]
MSDSYSLRRLRRVDYEQALQSMDSYIDITVDDLMELTRRAAQITIRRATGSLTVTEVMNQPVRSVRRQTSLAEAAHLMVNERISGLPVVDDNGRLVGIITEADFLRALGMPTQQPHHSLWQTLESLFGHLAHHGNLEAPDDPVETQMAHNVVCVGPEDKLHAVLDQMKQHSVKRVVVCDSERRVLGIVTRSDLVRVFFDRYTSGKRRQR